MIGERNRLALWGPDGVGRSTLASRLAELGTGAVSVLEAGPDVESLVEGLLELGSECHRVLILADVREPLDDEARRFAHLVSVLGVPPVTLVANKIDLADKPEAAYHALEEEWQELAAGIGLADTACLPISAARGDNVTAEDPSLSWYGGSTLADYLAGLDRGDRARANGARTQEADQIQATIIWRHDDPMLRGRTYGMRIGGESVTATVSPLKYRINLDTLVHAAATKLERGQLGVCALELSAPVTFAPYAEHPDAGSFVLVDQISEETVGVGLIQFALRRSENIRWQALTVDRAARVAQLGQSPCVVWLTGLSGAGKSTIANLVESELYRRGQHTYLLDGDNVRHGLNRDLGFTDADRVENIRRIAEVAKLMMDAGLIVLVSFISPFRSERLMARELFGKGEFFEVYVDTPLAVAEERDPKGLYGKARRGELHNFTGIDSPYEPPENPELRVDTASGSATEAARTVLELLTHRQPR